MAEEYFEFCGRREEEHYYLCAPQGIPGNAFEYVIDDEDGSWNIYEVRNIIDVNYETGIMKFTPWSMNPCGEIATQERIKRSTKERFLIAVGVL